MKRWLRNTLIVLVALLAAGGFAYYWYVGDGNPPGDLKPYEIDMAAIRGAAEALPGGKVSEVQVETVARFAFPSVAAVGGDGWNMVPMAAFSFRLVLPTDTVIIDTALNAEQGAALGAAIDDDAYARMEMAMAAATEIVVTHEHPDHIGGLIAYADPAGLSKALRLNKEQAEHVKTYGLAWPAAWDAYAPIDYTGPLAIAPGVVLIRAPGHTPGSQIVYVAREDGKEMLFVGDIGWTMRNIDTGKGRPRLLSQFMLNEDRDAVFAQLAALHALHEAEPDLIIVPGHDLAAIEELVAAETIVQGFRP